MLLRRHSTKPNTAPETLDGYLSAIAVGDAGSLAALYETTRGAVYGFALATLKNTHDAEDVLQETYVRIHGAAAGYRSHGKPLAWILTITRNLCMSCLRERQRSADLPQEDWEPYLTAKESVTAEERAILSECLHSLREEERQILLLHAAAGLRHRETAQLLQLPLPTVLSKYHRAIQKLKDRF